MPVNDPIADFLTRMRNAQHGRRAECAVPWSKIKQQMCELLKTQGYIADVKLEDLDGHKTIIVTFDPDRPKLLLKRISTPGGRTYVSFDELRGYMHGAGMAIISTSKGLLTDKDARKQKIGGELLCTIA